MKKYWNIFLIIGVIFSVSFCTFTNTGVKGTVGDPCVTSADCRVGLLCEQNLKVCCVDGDCDKKDDPDTSENMDMVTDISKTDQKDQSTIDTKSVEDATKPDHTEDFTIADESKNDTIGPDIPSTSDIHDPDTAIPDTFVGDTYDPDTMLPDTWVPDTLIADTAEPDTFVPDLLDTSEPEDTYIPMEDTYVEDTYIPEEDTYIEDTYIEDTYIPEEDTYIEEDTHISTDVILLEEPIIIDHTCTDLDEIPDHWIKVAKDKFRIGYSHTSHGSQIVTGIRAFRGEPETLFGFSITDYGLHPGVFFNDYCFNEGASDLGHNGYLGWVDATTSILNQADNDRNVVMWSWCGGVTDNTEDGIQKYLDAMNLLENTYPTILFIYMTGHVDGSGAEGNLNIRNNQIRDYCLKNNKILFDFADIESYDPDGDTDFMSKYVRDSCIYDGNGNGTSGDDATNWAEEWVQANPGSELAQITSGCGSCSHSHRLNCVLKGRAFWWMMARLAGWEGPTH